MLCPDLPDNEVERLNTLYSLNILDTNAEERFDRVTRIARNLFKVPMVTISLVDAKRQWFKSSEGIEAKETPREISFCGHAILNNGIMIVENAAQDLRFHDNPLVIGKPHIKFYLGCPLNVKNHKVGVLCLMDDKPRKFASADLEVMRDLADMVQLELESMHLSTMDELTSLSNRRGFLSIASHVFKMCQRENKSLSLLFFDLDKFKTINDTFGHAKGDEVLQFFSKSLLKHFRGSDVIARLGGDEFCVLCSGLDKKNTQKVLKRFHKALMNDKKAPYAIQYSVGSIQYNAAKHKELRDLLTEADLNMYGNKTIKSQVYSLSQRN